MIRLIAGIHASRVPLLEFDASNDLQPRSMIRGYPGGLVDYDDNADIAPVVYIVPDRFLELDANGDLMAKALA